jgi:hypothetical protein
LPRPKATPRRCGSPQELAQPGRASATATNGQTTFTTVAPRRNSIVIAGVAAIASADCSTAIGMNAPLSAFGRVSVALSGSICFAPRACPR